MQMKMYNKILSYISVAVLLLFVMQSQAQELLCRVDVSYSQKNITDIDPEVLDKMQVTAQDFINNRRWTDHAYEEEEKIEMSVKIQIMSKNGDSYKASFQIQSFRPVYNSNYKSIVFSHLDKDVSFQFKEYETVEYDDNSYRSNLTSLLAFYSYIVIGMDYDTFEKKGGTQFFSKAENVAQNAVTAGAWNDEKESKFKLAQNLLHSSFSGFREFMYKYHREGLDMMAESVEKGRTEAVRSLDLLNQAFKQNPGDRLFDILFYAKSKEMINIFSEANETDKKKVVGLLQKMNPTNVSEYQKITK